MALHVSHFIEAREQKWLGSYTELNVKKERRRRRRRNHMSRTQRPAHYYVSAVIIRRKINDYTCYQYDKICISYSMVYS